ncbi:MAG: endolytic transglycosylase MltG, partial [Bacteroidetes bacterium]|nr:endolytic transglycosylase MltG [Bacteroidota bacterium]
MLKFFKWLFILVFILLASSGYFLYRQVFGPYVKEDVEIKLPSDSSYENLLSRLDEKALIKNPLLFNLLAQKMRLATNVHSGKYLLKKGSSLYHLIATLRGGWQEPVKLTINNVNFKEDLCTKIGAQLEIDSSSLYAYITNDSCLNYLAYSQEDILCMFIPNTYEFYWNTSLNAFIEKIKKEHELFWNEERTAKAKAIGLEPEE